MSQQCYGRVTASKQGGASVSPERTRYARPVTDAGRRRDAFLALLGVTLAVAALGIIWGSRATIPHPLYVSELGADGMPTEGWFMAALLCLVGAGLAIAWAGRGVRAEVRILALWTPSLSLAASSSLFLVASQVTCTPGCPVPAGADFTWPDTIHIVSAVLAFAFACWAMLQSAFARQHRALAILSAVCAWSVGAVAGAGGLMSLFRFAVEVGAWCEFAATTIAILWVVVFGTATAVERLRGMNPLPAEPESRADVRAGTHSHDIVPG